MSDSTMTQDAIVIERTFNAPVDFVWQLWTEPNSYKQWYGPQGMTIPVAEMDVRVGGKRLVCMEMQMPDRSMRMWFTGEYREVVPKERLVFTESMSDEHGNVMPPSAMGMPEGSPETTEVTVLLEDVNGRTRMTMIHAGVPADSPGASGWNQAFEKMAKLIKSTSN